jgi:hypothetical protein
VKLIVDLVFVDERPAPSAFLSQSGSRLAQMSASWFGRLRISAQTSGDVGQASDSVQPGRPSAQGIPGVPTGASQLTP